MLKLMIYGILKLNNYHIIKGEAKKLIFSFFFIWSMLLFNYMLIFDYSTMLLSMPNHYF